MTNSGCINGHAPEHMETRASGARVCIKCRNTYFATKVRKFKTRKVNTTNEQHAD